MVDEIEVNEGEGTPVNHVELTVDVSVSVAEDDGRVVVVGVDMSLAGREVVDEACVLSSMDQ